MDIGTIYIGTTMSVQDNDATINCVCVVIRTHMLDATKEGIEPLPEYDIFKDIQSPNKVASETNQKVKFILILLKTCMLIVDIDLSLQSVFSSLFTLYLNI
jgi:hypothetical protein